MGRRGWRRIGARAWAEHLTKSPEWAGPLSAGSLVSDPRHSALRCRSAALASHSVAPQPACLRGRAVSFITPQRAGEAAWHRRARRQRGAARTLLRVAAAAGLISRHHASGASAPMGGGRGKGGNGDATGTGHDLQWNSGIGRLLQNMQRQSEQQQQLLHALVGGDDWRSPQWRSGKGGGGKGGDQRGGVAQSSGGGTSRVGQRQERGRRTGTGAQARPGDWRCAGCGAYPCYARTSVCFQCKRPRQDRPSPTVQSTGADNGRRLTASANMSTYLGPVGAGGSRPILGTRAPLASRGDSRPSYRVPGASVAAKAEEAKRQPSADDGWQPVRAPRSSRAASAEAAPLSAPTTDVGNLSPTAALPTRNSWAALFEEEQEEREAQQQCDDGDADDADDHDMGTCTADDDGPAQQGDDADPEPTEAELKGIWLNHCAAYRRLERGQPPAPPGVLATVRAQRDGAEQAWRAARTPHPLHKRLRWAENELRAAEAKEAARREELAEHEEQAARRTRDIQAMLDVDAARTARKRDALRALHQEGAQDPSDLPEIGKAARVAITDIGTDIAPMLSAIIEQLGDEHQGIRQDLQLLSTSLGRVEGVLRDAADNALADVDQQRQHHQLRRPTIFDISDDAAPRAKTARRHGDLDVGGRCDETDQAGGTTCVDATATAASQRWTKQAPNAPWRRATTTSSAGAVEEARETLQAATATQPASALPPSPSQTNDLQVAERLAREQAIQQQHEALLRQQMAQQDPGVVAQEEQRRIQREQARVEEMQRHQVAAQMAATAAAAEDARRKEERWASLSPEERDQARRLLEQQAAVGAHVFGSRAAGQMAGLVHQSHVQEAAQEQASQPAGWSEEEVQQLMGMSPEDIARWDHERQSLM